jgi:hypothetical protein
MHKLAYGGRLASSFAMLVFVSVFLAAPPEAVGDQAFDFAYSVMIDDISTQMLLIANKTGVPVFINGTGMSSVQTDGSAYSFSFTAGGISVTDMATLTPDGVQPGTGTWMITSNLYTSALTTITYDATTQSYTLGEKTTFPPIQVIDGKGNKVTANDSEDTQPAPGVPGHPDSLQWTFNNLPVGAPLKTDTTLVTAPSVQWSATVEGTGTFVSISGNATTFDGAAIAVPEPSSIIMLVIGVALSTARRWRTTSPDATPSQTV